MNKRYIDIDSGFRDRKIWPNPAEFGIQLAQTGTKYGIINAKNPITLAYPYYQWQWGCTVAAGDQTAGLRLGDGTGIALGGPGPAPDQPPQNARISWLRGFGTGTKIQPIPRNACVLGAGVLVGGGTITNNITRSNSFFNGLLFQSDIVPGNAGDYSAARIIAYKANFNSVNRNIVPPTGAPLPVAPFAGILALESELLNWNGGTNCAIENNANSGVFVATTWEVGSEVFIPGGVNADGVYVGDIYEAVMYSVAPASTDPLCHQFRTITAYDGTRRVITLNAPLTAGWISPANDTNGLNTGVPGCTYLHRIRRSLPLLPQDAPTLAVDNMPLTLGNDIIGAVYSVEIVNPGTGYAVGLGTIRPDPTSTRPATLNILSLTTTGGITSVSIAIPGTTPGSGFSKGQVLPLRPVPAGGTACTIRVTGVGFGVNVSNSIGLTTATNFTNQIFYVPALNQPFNAPTGTATVDPSAAQQFIPQRNTVVSLTGDSYSNDSTASSIIRGDFFDAVGGPTHFLVIEPFQNTFPVAGFEFNILPYDEDHVVPMNYTGSTVSQSQMVCYQMTLESITIPNTTITALGLGGLIAFYPYIYVEFRNESASSGQGNTPTLYSNNPASNTALWKCSITDTPTPLISRFIKIRADGMQTVKFKPNDNLYFKVTLPNGQTFETGIKDTAPPLLPNLLLQISFSVGIERL